MRTCKTCKYFREKTYLYNGGIITVENVCTKKASIVEDYIYGNREIFTGASPALTIRHTTDNRYCGVNAIFWEPATW